MKPRIFISAVSREMKSARQLVANTLTALGYEPVWQDIFSTSGEDIRPMLRKQVDSCGAVLQIVGDAYGFEPPQPDESFGRVSYTQYEALYAKSQGKKVYYLVAMPDMPRDSEPDMLDADDGHSERSEQTDTDTWQRRSLQANYRNKIQSAEHVFYPIQTQHEAELTVRRLKQDLDGLRTRFRVWMAGISAALVFIALGVVSSIFLLNKQSGKIDETLRTVQQQTTDLSSLARQVNQPERIREQLAGTIMKTFSKAIAEADKLKTWRDRDNAKKLAVSQRDSNLERIEEFLEEIEIVLGSGKASPEYLEMIRIFNQEGAEAAVAYVDSQKENLKSTFMRNQASNRQISTEFWYPSLFDWAIYMIHDTACKIANRNQTKSINAFMDDFQTDDGRRFTSHGRRSARRRSDRMETRSALS